MTGQPSTRLISAMAPTFTEPDPDRLAGEVAAPHVGDLDASVVVLDGDVDAAHHDLLAQPPGQRLPDGELDGRGQDGVAGSKTKLNSPQPNSGWFTRSPGVVNSTWMILPRRSVSSSGSGPMPPAA